MPSLAKRSRWWAEYAALATAHACVQRLSDRRRSAWGRALGRFVHDRIGWRRSIAQAQLQAAFPERDAAWCAATSLRAYEQLGTSLLEFMAMGAPSDEEYRERVALDRAELLEPLRGRRRGVLFTTGHFGNWELLGACMRAYGFPLHVVARTQSNPYVDRMQNEHRARAGMRVIKADASIRQLVRTLRDGGFVAMLPDVNAGDDGVFVDFLGRPASTPPGLAYFAWKLGCPIVPAYIVRQPDGRHVAHITPPITPDPSLPEDEAIRTLTQAHTDRLAEFVRRYPDHWYWLHRRWKTRPPKEDP